MKRIIQDENCRGDLPEPGIPHLINQITFAEGFGAGSEEVAILDVADRKMAVLFPDNGMPVTSSRD